MSINKETTLHNGTVIPSLGYRIDKDYPDEIHDKVIAAYNAGFRHFDLPVSAECHTIFKDTLEDAGIERYKLFLTAKLGNDDHGYNAAKRALDRTLKHLGTDYIDLYLINWPNPEQFRDQYETISLETWRAMEDIYKSGKARAIGLANFHAHHIEHIMENCTISPMVNQARIYPGFPFENNLNCANEHNIQTIGFLPPHHDEILQSRELQIFAEKYHVTPRQICIRYLLEKQCLALSQGKDPEDLKAAFHAFDFSISEEDMRYMDVMKNYGLDSIDPDTCDF